MSLSTRVKFETHFARYDQRVSKKIAVLLILTVLTAGTATGCAESTKPVIVSDGCAHALENLAVATTNDFLSDEQANSYDLASLNACQSAEEYIAGVLKNPLALGFESLERSQVIDYGLRISCPTLDTQKKSPVCADAETDGLLNNY